jgi:hypothetical protein
LVPFRPILDKIGQNSTTELQAAQIFVRPRFELCGLTICH